MNSITFQALVVSETVDKNYIREIRERTIDELPEGKVLVRVHYSSLNYKDALSCTGNKGVTRRYPHTPGIDAAGIVESSQDSGFKAGDQVIVTSHDLGMNTSGGFGQYIRVPAEWVVHLPEGLTLRESMVYGTAGYTAGLSVHSLRQHGVTADQGPIVVTGATGGVGSTSVALLAHLGYSVAGSTGKTEEEAFLKSLGADEVISREEVNDDSGKPLLKERWAGGIDTVGDNTLVSLLKSCCRGGAVAATGLVRSPNLHATVFPFILRGVSLLGIDSQETPLPLRRQTWARLSMEWKPESLDRLAEVCTLNNLDRHIDRILEGRQLGRIVVDLQ